MNRQKLATILGAVSVVCILGLAGILFLNTKSPLVQDPIAARVSQEEKAKLTDLTIAQWADQAEAEQAPEEFEGSEEDEQPETSTEDFGNFTIDFEKASAEAKKAQDLEKSRQEGLGEAEEENEAEPAVENSKEKHDQAYSATQNQNKPARKKTVTLASTLKVKVSRNKTKAEEGQKKGVGNPATSKKKNAMALSADSTKDSEGLLSTQMRFKEAQKKERLGTDSQKAGDENAAEKAAIEKALASIEDQKNTIKMIDEDPFSEIDEKTLGVENYSKKTTKDTDDQGKTEGNQEGLTDDPVSLLGQIKKNEENLNESPSKALAPQSLYTLAQLKQKGVIVWNGYRFTYYSQSVLPGNKLTIPGRHVNSAGFVADGSGNIVIAYGGRRGDVIPTPFGFWGKIYDYCETPGTYDCYVK